MSNPNDYLHHDVHVASSARDQAAACGDLIRVLRREAVSYVILADGQGSGIQAAIAAELHAGRLHSALEQGRDLGQAFAATVAVLAGQRGRDRMWAAVNIARVRGDGSVTVLSYDAPPAILWADGRAMVLPRSPLPAGQDLVHEARYRLRAGEHLLLVSDGLTEVGLGGPDGPWGIEGLCTAIDQHDRASPETLPETLVGLAGLRAHRAGTGDDMSAALISCRPGIVVEVLSGPPSRRADAPRVVADFLAAPGIKVICGASTAAMVAEQMGQRLEVLQQAGGLAPPPSRLPGITLVCEGVVTLNQVLNVIDEDNQAFEHRDAVSDLHHLLRTADRIRFRHGPGRRSDADSLDFRRQHILARPLVLERLAERLRNQGKLVTLLRH